MTLWQGTQVPLNTTNQVYNSGPMVRPTQSSATDRLFYHERNRHCRQDQHAHNDEGHPVAAGHVKHPAGEHRSNDAEHGRHCHCEAN